MNSIQIADETFVAADPAEVERLYDRLGNFLLEAENRANDANRPRIELLQALGCSVFVIAETSNAIHGARDCPLAASPVLPPMSTPSTCS